ncbi:MAG: hypothetical protein HDS66_08905 [Bacteroidales bacterium]|nr:hypothetical protein [Bacteroidales bacterium]
MRRNVLLIEPNYRTKFPPIGLMKLATYFKNRGDNVVFYKGEIKNFILERITDKCIRALESVCADINWRLKHDSIFAFIKTRKKEHLNKLVPQDNDCETLITDWLNQYKDYYWKKQYLNPSEREWDWIGVTTMFTFYFDITVKTINEVKQLLKPTGTIMVGGVLATLQPDKILEATGIQPKCGLLNKPGEIDADSSEIIDTLPLDYSILEEIDYRYEMSNAYYGSLTKGCGRNCAFCAVQKLEPDYVHFMPMSTRIKVVNEHYGEQRDLLLMDNNVLASEKFDEIIDDIISAGFHKGATFLETDRLAFAISRLEKKENVRAYIRCAQREILTYYNGIKDNDLSFKVYKILLDRGIFSIGSCTPEAIIETYHLIKDEYDKMIVKRRPRQRIVDFNQGVDARLFTERNAKRLAEIAISPLRIAFDSMDVEKEYLQAIRWSAAAGIKNFSNYLLYNFNDFPEDLYERLKINVELCAELDLNIYSFPMKYHPLMGQYSHDRDYIGKHWNRKYIRAIQAIMNATKGSVGRGQSFFYKAFGRNLDEYYTLLEMPDTFIIYRFFFEWLDKKKHKLGMSKWVKAINAMTVKEQELFFSILHDKNFNASNIDKSLPNRIVNALSFYKNRRDDIAKEGGELYALKKEFDSLPKEQLNYIKESFAGTIIFKRDRRKSN